jgi:hypothetical protein
MILAWNLKNTGLLVKPALTPETWIAPGDKMLQRA